VGREATAGMEMGSGLVTRADFTREAGLVMGASLSTGACLRRDGLEKLGKEVVLLGDPEE
jgi:hypothetical protein